MDRLVAALTVVALIFLSLLAGAAMMHFRFGTDDYFREVFALLEAGKIVETKETRRMGLNAMGAMPRRNSDYGVPPVPEGWDPGVRIYDAARVQAGYTSYASMMPRSPIRLINMQGDSIHEWDIPDLNSITERLDGKSFPRDINAQAADFHIYPDGRVVMVLANDLGFPPLGFAVVMVDRDSNVLWHYTKQAHHQVNVAEDGRIAIILNEAVTTPVPNLGHVPTPFREDQVVILSPEGEELAYISVLDAFLNSRWIGALKRVSLSKNSKDKFHVNAAKFLTAKQAAAIPGAKGGDILLSMRNTDTIAVLNPDTQEIVWAITGPWLRQHDPHILPNGNMMLFDNHGNLTNPRSSRVLEINPRNHKLVWEWPGDRDFNIFTGVNGAIDPLKNGNVLIAESSLGRLLEVTRDGDVVWEYIVQERRLFRAEKGKQILGTKVWHPKRHDVDELLFLEEI